MGAYAGGFDGLKPSSSFANVSVAASGAPAGTANPQLDYAACNSSGGVSPTNVIGATSGDFPDRLRLVVGPVRPDPVQPRHAAQHLTTAPSAATAPTPTTTPSPPAAVTPAASTAVMIDGSCPVHQGDDQHPHLAGPQHHGRRRDRLGRPVLSRPHPPGADHPASPGRRPHAAPARPAGAASSTARPGPKDARRALPAGQPASPPLLPRSISPIVPAPRSRRTPHPLEPPCRRKVPIGSSGRSGEITHFIMSRCPKMTHHPSSS